jgi:hypothetical protein
VETWIWVLIPVTAIAMWGARGIAQAMALGRAHQAQRMAGPGDDAVRADLEALRQRVAELEERQDFTERMLTEQREHGRLER